MASNVPEIEATLKAYPEAATVVSPQEGAAKTEQNRRLSQLESRVAELERTASELRTELNSLQGTSPTERARYDAYDPRLLGVVAITEEMFGTPEVNVLCDPEDPDTSFVVFSVKCGGEMVDLVDKRIEWHERIRALPPGNSGRFRLSIVLCSKTPG